MPDLLVAATHELPEALLHDVRALCDRSFDGDFGDDDWDHCLGGLHALVLDGGSVLAHGAVVARRFRLEQRPVDVGYVEAVAVAPGHRGQGLGSQVMTAIETIVATSHELGALSTSDLGLPLYLAHGWVPWRGRLLADTATGPVHLPDEEGAVLVLGGTVDLEALDLEVDLTADFRAGDVF